MLNGDNENVDSKDSEDVRMVEFEEKNPIVYTKESGSSFDIINSTCTAAIIYHPYKQRCFKYDDKL